MLMWIIQIWRWTGRPVNTLLLRALIFLDEGVTLGDNPLDFVRALTGQLQGDIFEDVLLSDRDQSIHVLLGGDGAVFVALVYFVEVDVVFRHLQHLIRQMSISIDLLNKPQVAPTVVRGIQTRLYVRPNHQIGLAQLLIRQAWRAIVHRRLRRADLNGCLVRLIASRILRPRCLLRLSVILALVLPTEDGLYNFP